jgi:hypothetical protein
VPNRLYRTGGVEKSCATAALQRTCRDPSRRQATGARLEANGIERKEKIMMNAAKTGAMAGMVLSALLIAGDPALARPAADGTGAFQLAQAQQQPSGETESGTPADQPAATDRRRAGPGMMAGENGMSGPEMRKRMQRMHGEMRGRMGQGMMGAPGMMSGMMSGMMGGMGPIGMCPMMMARDDKDLSAEQVRAILEGQIAWTGNKRLKVGAVEPRDDESYIADIVTVDDSLVQRVEVDRGTGAMRPAN